jgi:hypothetical protein
MNERTVGLGEIARVFLKIGAMSYGGPAIMGIMQTEIQEKREWIPKQQFVEGLALVNIPGEHEYRAPELFEAKTACGFYQGVTDQVKMSRTPGSYRIPLVPRGASRPEWTITDRSKLHG